jgi:hypothetical protein
MQETPTKAILFAYCFSITLAMLTAGWSVYSLGGLSGTYDELLVMLICAATGAILLLLLLGTSIYLYRKGEGLAFVARIWSYVLAAASIVPVHTLFKGLTS